MLSQPPESEPHFRMMVGARNIFAIIYGDGTEDVFPLLQRPFDDSREYEELMADADDMITAAITEDLVPHEARERLGREVRREYSRCFAAY